MNVEYFNKILFKLNSADPDEMPPYAAFHLGLAVCQSARFKGFLVFNGLTHSVYMKM